MNIIDELKEERARNPRKFALIGSSAILALAALGYVGVSDFASTPPAKTVSVTIPASQTAQWYSCRSKTYAVVGMQAGKIVRLHITLPDCHPKTASTTTISPLARAESSLTSEWVHFCFSSIATAGTNSTQQNGCGSQNYAAKIATVSVASSVDLSGQSQSKKLAATRIGKSEWIDVGGKWQKSTAPFPAVSPGAIASLLRATPTVKKVAGIKVSGQATTGYQGVFTAADLAAHKNTLTPSMATALAGMTSDTWTAYLNHAGQVVDVSQKESVTLSGKTISVGSTVLYSHYGQPATITAPGPAYVGPPAS